MSYTFYNCHNLTQAPNIPNSVTSMSNTFYNCHNLTQAPNIPNSVTDMASTFCNCFTDYTAELYFAIILDNYNFYVECSLFIAC